MSIGRRPSCGANTSRTAAGTSRVSGRKWPRQRNVQSCTLKPSLLAGPRQRSTCSRSAIVRLKYLRRSAASISAGSRSAASTTSGSSTSPWVLTSGGSVTASARRAQCTQVVVAERSHTGLGIDLSGRESQVAKELLHLVDRHVPGVEQNRRDRVPQEMRVYTFGDACIPRTRGDHGLDGANG